MGNTECQCIATHQNQKFLQIYNPNIQPNPNAKPNSKTKHPQSNALKHQQQFNILPCNDVSRQRTEQQKEQMQSKVSVYHLDEPSVQYQQKEGLHLDMKENHLAKNRKLKESSIRPLQTNRKSGSKLFGKLNQSSVNKNPQTCAQTVQASTKKQNLRQRVNKNIDKHLKPTTSSVGSQKNIPNPLPPLNLQADCSFLESSFETPTQPDLKLLSFQKGISLRQEYEFKKMLQKNLLNLKEKLKLWNQLAHEQSFFAQEQKFYFYPELFDSKKIKKQDIYKIVYQKSSQNSPQQQPIEKLTKFYRGNLKPNQQTPQNFTLQGLGEQYCITNDNYSSFTYFNGCYKDNHFDGHGIFIHADLDYYIGEWKQSRAQGHGVYQHYQGMRYVGSWKNDQQHGQGEQYWQDGAVFKGKFFKGYKIFGEFRWPNDTSYIGQFNQNRLQGKGKFTYQDNRYYYGQWKDNMMHGYGEFKWNNGQHFKGNYELDKKQGDGVLILGDGTTIEAKWKLGKIHGKGKVTKSNGQVKVIEWDNGVEIKGKAKNKEYD